MLEKERQFNLAREKIENTLESFYRSMASCVYQLNKKWLPNKMSLLRVIDRRYETSEIFIKSDEESDDNWLMLVYLKDNKSICECGSRGQINPEKNISTEYKPNEIFKFSDSLVDSLTSMIDREFRKKIELVNYILQWCDLTYFKNDSIIFFKSIFFSIFFKSFWRFHNWF